MMANGRFVDDDDDDVLHVQEKRNTNSYSSS